MVQQTDVVSRRPPKIRSYLCKYRIAWCCTTVLVIHILSQRNLISKMTVSHAAGRLTTGPIFATAAVTSAGRWDAQTSSRALQIMYSSLVKSQVAYPLLYVHSDSPDVIPTLTTMSSAAAIRYVHLDMMRLRHASAYDVDWHILSRAKLEMVENLILKHKTNVVWIDLDTLVFVDLSSTFSISSSWVIGYQNGACLQGNCTRDVIPCPIDPENDAHGDLWSLDLKAIQRVRWLEESLLREGRPLPKYDLQGYFSMMMQNKLWSAKLLQDVLPFSFGFHCSGYLHPTAENLKLFLDRNLSSGLRCPAQTGLDVPEEVGTMSFTAPTFQKLFLDSESLTFDFISDEHVRNWLHDWFYTPNSTMV